MSEFTDQDFDKFMEDNKGLMEDLAKSEEIDNLKNKLNDLKSAHKLIERLIQELENEIQNYKA